jgi:hypothetical protein
MVGAVFVLLLAQPTLAAISPIPWHHPLCLANHGYWPVRMMVQITNNGTNLLTGVPATVAAGGLTGQRAESVRVCRADGPELLFEVLAATGATKRRGILAADDRILVPAQCGAKSSTNVWIYAGNDAAWPVRDFLRAGLANGGFESGSNTPEGWTASGDDAQHHLSWETNGSRSGTHCLKAEAMESAAATWFQWRQHGIPIVPGVKYELRGWVRCEKVKGQAGWYVHADGDRPMLVNQTGATDGGTHGWKEVRARFTAPPSARVATIGTLLYGTGRAWFDDVALASETEGPQLRVVAGPVERLSLAPPRVAAGAQFSAAWPVRAVVSAVNVSPEPLEATAILVDLSPALGRWLRIQPGADVRLIDAASGTELPVAMRSGNNLFFSATLPPRSISEFHVYLNPRKQQDQAPLLAGYEQCLKSPLNRAPHMEAGKEASLPAGWLFGDDQTRTTFAARLADEARFGQRSLRFTIPTNLPPNWIGWRSLEIPVQPGATYYYGGFLKSKGLDGTAALNAHWHTKSGALTASTPFVGTQPAVSGDADWTQSSVVVEAPPDAATIQLHLTMNAHGTLAHSGILLCEVQGAEVARLETADKLESVAGLHVWQVNPLIKVFPDDPPGPSAAAVTLECARNEYEPFQLVVRADQSVKSLQVQVSALRNDQGAALPEVKVERVGYVPIDHASGYFLTKATEEERKLPRGPGATDGWAGLWPDPLLPASAGDLIAKQNQPFWFTVRTVPDTSPGEYRGEVVFCAPGVAPVTLPVTVKVLPFALPERTKLKAIFDFRFGPGGAFGAGASGQEERRRWLRFLAAHRLGLNEIEPPPVFTCRDGKVSMDATAFDAAARYCFEELGMNAAYTPGFFYMFGWAYPPKKFFNYEPFTPEWKSVFQQTYRLFSTHLTEKGWHDRFVYYVSDEPHFDRPFIVEQMKQLCALIHEVDATIPIYSSTWRHCRAWDNALDLWGVGQYGCFPVAEIEPLRQAGKQFWFTCDGQMATDTPYLATERLLPYYCFNYGVTGFEFWGLAWWTYDPWQTGWHTFIRQSDDGKTHYWIRYPNGDGFLTYPGKAFGVDGPLSTIRLEQVREGLEDYEALTMLADLVQKAKRNGRSVAKGERALEMAKRLVDIPNAGGLRSTEILPDPDQIPALRQAVNAAMVELLR